MLLQGKNIIGTKKGVSVMIGYILLIALAVVMSVIVYQWLKTYVPKDVAKCPDGVAVFIQKAEYTCVGGLSSRLELTLKNNGKFNIAGYYIHVTSTPTQELATIDISGNITEDELEDSAGYDAGGYVEFVTGGANGMSTGDVKKSVFDLDNPTPLPLYYKVQVIPVRYEDKKFVSCSSARVSEVLDCEE